MFDATARTAAAGALADTLVTRGKHYEGPGGYAETAQTAQAIKEVFRGSPNWRNGNLTPAMRESLDMIANKVARILNGNAAHADSWHDLAGYATLAEKDCDRVSAVPAVIVKCECGWQGPQDALIVDSIGRCCPVCCADFTGVGL